MWTRLLLVALVAAASAQAWKPNTGYSYTVQSRTLSALHQVGDQYSGMLMRATLKLYAQSPSKLFAKVSKPEYANVHQALPGGWGSSIPDQTLEWQKFDLTDKPFIIQLRNGVIDRLVVDPDMPRWELNIIKGIVSQLQVDTKAENHFTSLINDLPSDDSDNAVFKAMEDTVTGKCEVLYDISRLPEYVLQSHPHLAPFPNPNPEESHTLDIVKTSNYSHCEKRPSFHSGFNGENDWEPASSKMGQFFARSSVSRIVVTGRPSQHLIQSAVTTNKVILRPAIHNKQEGMVVSRMNLTLLAVKENEDQQQWEQTEQQATLQVKDLVYDLTHPSKQHQKHNDDDSQERNEQSQDQQDFDEQRMTGTAARRFRRSLKSAQKEQRKQRQQEQDSHESSESSSFEDSSISAKNWHEPRPDMNQAPQIPFLPFFIGNKGESVLKRTDIVKKAAEIARDIAKDFQTPKSVPEKSTLSKFLILTRLVQTMNTEQLQKVTEQVFTSEENTKEQKAWKAFRDSVSEAGTSPALVIMKEWIESKKVQGEEAAEMLGQLSEKAVTPTKEFIQLFFEIAKSEVVKSQRSLNTTAILSFANLVRNAQVDRRSAHVRYPTHTFGRMNPTQALAVTRDFIPYFAKQLREAVREGDSVLIQTYVRALGNVAHPKILSVFEPYLEGENQVSDFQRLHMVIALNKLVKVHPSLARSVLFKIFKNSSEKPDIRSAAVFLLMKTNPPASMLQRMAGLTNGNAQVRSAVKTALESAATLEAPESLQLAENAQAAVNGLNNTLNGPGYSRIRLASGKVSEMDVAFRAGFSTIGSEDYLFPKAAFVHFRETLAGLKKEALSTGIMASSTKDLINLIAAQTQKAYAQPENNDILGELAQQVEGNFFMKAFGAERFYAFDNHTIERYPSLLRHMLKQLPISQTFSMQKMFTQESLTLAFPTASGLPFIYSLMTPTVVSVQAKIQAETKSESHTLKSAAATAEVKFLFSTRTETRMGFIAPFNSKIYMAGTDKDAQINLPIRAEFSMNTAAEGSDIRQSGIRIKVQPRQPEEDIQVATLRSRVFTAQQNLFDFKPAEQKLVHVQTPQQWKFTFGKHETGMAFRVEASTEQKFFDYANVYRQLKKLEVLSAMASFNKEMEIKNYDYSITYDHDKSKAKAVVLTAEYDRLSKMAESEPYGYPNSERTQSKGYSGDEENVFEDNLAIPSNTAPNSAERLRQFLHRVADTMRNSHADAIDISAQFKGDRDAIYIATVATARSPMKERLAALVYLRRAPVSGNTHEVAMYPSVHIPHAPLINFQKAISNKPTAFVEAKVSFGQNLEEGHSQIHIKSKFERSERREQHVREQPITQLCEQQASRGNNFLPACQNATIAAGRLDKCDITVKFARIPDSFKNATYKAYSLARHFGWEYSSEDLVSANNGPKKIYLNVRFTPDLQSANVSIFTPQMNSAFWNVRVSPLASAFVVPSPNYKPSDLFSRFVLGREYNPTCTVDKSAVSTFDNKTFSFDIEEEWYLVAQYVPKTYLQTKFSPAGQMPFIKVQARQTSSWQKEVKIFFGTKDIVEISPRDEGQHPEVKVNNKIFKVESKPIEVKSKVDNRTFVRFYRLPSGTVMLSAPQYYFHLAHDSTTFVLKLDNQYRSDIRGLCGTFNGEVETDFTAPKNCIMKSSQDFIKSYTVTADGNLKHMDSSLTPRACIYKKYSPGNIISDFEAGREESLRQAPEKNQGHTIFRTKVVEQEGQLCFSLRPLPTCTGSSRPVALKEKSIPFHCVADSAASRHWAKMAQKGVSLDVAAKGSNRNFTVKVPESCRP